MTRYTTAAVALPAAMLITVALGFAGCTAKEVKAGRPDPLEPAEVFTTLVRARRCGTFVMLLERAGLAETLKGPGPFTLFAPTDQAFAALGEGRLDYLMEHHEELKALLLRHVAPAKIPSSEVTWSTTIRTITGRKLTVTVADGIEMIDGALVLERDIMATNGVIHVVDAVIDTVLARPEAP